MVGSGACIFSHSKRPQTKWSSPGQNETPLLVHQHLYSSLEFYNLSTHINKNPHKLLLNMCGTVPTGSCINININTEACMQSVMVEAVGLAELFPAPWG